MATAILPPDKSPPAAVADADLIAAFLAKGGKVTAAQAAAYGVDPSADRERRANERAERMVQSAERYAENVREAYHVGGRSAAIEAMNGRSY
jgi:hypothetical protein